MNSTFKHFKENFDKLSPKWDQETKKFVDWCWGCIEAAETDAQYYEMKYLGIWPESENGKEYNKEKLTAWRAAKIVSIILDAKPELKVEVEKILKGKT